MSDGEVRVRVRARGARDELLGMSEGTLLARVSAPPVDGRANRALCKLIAGALGVPPSSVAVARGERSREKLVRVRGVDSASIERTLR